MQRLQLCMNFFKLMFCENIEGFVSSFLNGKQNMTALWQLTVYKLLLF